MLTSGEWSERYVRFKYMGSVAAWVAIKVDFVTGLK